ncbi:phytanoyl-CoA dioxygenase family protein [Aeoliella sp. ICT_H6.2]|uniref:Phytanoyl-CoA dioxygenase family protein n=1 Tax=Aeoliella straminimaris TaxID=2954799 RepID=A0A9X2JFV0_9BACT|nr:phytanoyl-CoA dioxygenase family protein [Aeoliella straminimaris]MCO6043662.1 phytanoyl-CoA dioxygenase family protein [Aeoliella straminimaris]
MTRPVQDLSLVHHPIGPLFSEPISVPSEVLTEGQLAQFERDGFITGVQLLTDMQCDALCEELEEFFAPDHDGHELWYEYHTNESTTPETALFHALGAWRLRPGFHDLLWNARLVAAARQLLGATPRFWHDQLFCKPAHHGGVVAWHQDYSYWTRTTPLAHLTCWLPLDDCDEENGSIQYVPGSHRWDLLPQGDLAGNMDGIRKLLTDEQCDALENPVVVKARRGEATFHHPLTVHGSQANLSDRPRRVAVVNLVADGVKSDTDEPLLEGVPVIPQGEPLSGQFFPLLG